MMQLRSTRTIVYLSLILSTIIHSNETKICPNVLFIVVDDLRPSLGCYGSNVITPNIDSLAKKGIIFNQAFAQQALCGPSRGSLLTSLRPDNTHIICNQPLRRKHGRNFTTLPQYFKEHGYHTVSVGKIFHPGYSRKSNKSDDYPLSWSEVPYHPPTQAYKNAQDCPDILGRYHENIVCPVDVNQQPSQTLPDIQSSDYAVKFLQNYSRSEPFFLAVGFHKPHIPLKFPNKYLDLYPLFDVKIADNASHSELLPNIAWNPWTDLRSRDDISNLNISFPFGFIPRLYQKKIRQSYFAAISYIDDQIGKVLSQIQKSNLAAKTTIFLIGDHGWSLGEHGEWSKFSNFEVSVKVPLIVYDPFLFKPNNIDQNPQENFRSSDALVELVDVFPTLADISGLPVPPLCTKNHTISSLCTEGLSFYPVIKYASYGKSIEWKSGVFSQYPRPSVFPQYNSDQPKVSEVRFMGYSIRTQRFRYTQWVSYDYHSFKPNWTNIVSEELYDHKFDSFEAKNAASNPYYAKFIKSLSYLLKKGWRSTLPPKY